MITKENIIKQFELELSTQRIQKTFNEKNLLKYCSNSIMYGLSENDKSEITLYITNRIYKYKRIIVINRYKYNYKHLINNISILSYYYHFQFNHHYPSNGILINNNKKDIKLTDNEEVIYDFEEKNYSNLPTSRNYYMI